MIKAALIILTFIYFVTMGWAVHLLNASTTRSSRQTPTIEGD